MKYEYKQALQGVKRRKDVGHHDRLLVQVQESKGPRETQEEHEHEGASQPRPVTSRNDTYH